jgi:hypothetical protein
MAFNKVNYEFLSASLRLIDSQVYIEIGVRSFICLFFIFKRFDAFFSCALRDRILWFLEENIWKQENKFQSSAENSSYKYLAWMIENKLLWGFKEAQPYLASD